MWSRPVGRSRRPSKPSELRVPRRVPFLSAEPALSGALPRCPVNQASIGFRAPYEVLRVRSSRDRQAGRDPRHRLRLRHHPRRGARDRGAHRRPDGDQVPGADRRAHEGRRRPVRRHARRGGPARRGDPRARDRRSHAARRAGGPQGPGQAGVLRGGGLGRHPQAAADPVQRHGRDRHRAGRGGAPGPRRPRPLLEPDAVLGLPGQADHRGRRSYRRRAESPDADRGAPGAAVSRARHDAGRDQPARPAGGRQLRGARRPHGDGERGHAAPEGAVGGSGHRRGRGHPRGPRAERRSRRRSRRSTPPTIAA